MLNNVVLVGKIYEVPAKDDLDFILEVERSYCNSQGIYEKDFFKCNLWLGIRDNMITYCKEGDIVTVKGRLESNYSKDDELIINDMRIIAERVVFLKKTYSNNK